MKIIKIKKGDTVKILAGAAAGKTGLVERVFPKTLKIGVTGANQVKRHVRKSAKYPQGGIIVKSAPIHLSNLALVCPSCKKSTRVGAKIIDGKKYRVCQKCGDPIDEKSKTK